VTDRPTDDAADPAGGANSVAPAAPIQRKRDGGWLLRQVALYLALFFGAAIVIGGASALAHQFGFDLDGNKFGRFLILGVYGVGALVMLLRFGG